MRDRFRVSVIAPKRLTCYQLKIVDTQTHETRTRMTDVPRGGRNRRRAEQEAANLQQSLNASAGCLPARVTWEQFRERIEEDFLPERSPATQVAYTGVLNRYEQSGAPKLLRDVDSAALRNYCQSMRTAKFPEATVQKHLRHLFAVLRWAQSEGLLAEVPAKPPQPLSGRGKATQSKGRPLAPDELRAYLEAIPAVCHGERADHMRRLVEGILLTGFRLGDALRARWDDSGDVYPLFRDGLLPVWIFSSQQKSRRAEEVAMLPACADFVLQTPPSEREGWFFPLSGPSGRLTETTVSKILSDVGRAAGVLVAGVNPRTGQPKYASAHDLRRTFAQEQAYHVTPAVLKHLMRHRSHLTTDRFYLGADAQVVGAQLCQVSPDPSPAGMSLLQSGLSPEV